METPSHVNLEFKAPLDDVDSVEAGLLTLGAAGGGVLVQRDTYFRVPHGRLKLREMPDRAELIAYERDEDGPTMHSRYTVTPIDHPARERERLTAEHGVRGVVEKSRSLWFYRNARIHIDHVGGLGTFIEIEVVDPRTPEEGSALMADLLRALSLDVTSALRLSYIDMLESSSDAGAVQRGLRQRGAH